MIECEECENGLVMNWQPTRHGWITTAKACKVCNGSGRVEGCPNPDGPCGCLEAHEPTEYDDERGQPHRDSGLPTFEQIEEWERLR